MIERILDFSDTAARLSVRHQQLIVKQGAEERSLPLEEVAALVVSHPQVIYTQAVLAGLMENGGVFIACDERRMPSGMMLPLAGHHLQTERLQHQVGASQPVRKRAWQQLVCAKVRAQGRLLDALHGDDKGLIALAGRVKSGDPDNVEGQAARRYWPALFADPAFRRDQDAGGLNAFLNYGYAVLRGIVGRAVVAAGLHPSIGVHHHNRYDAFCLADDVMEPFRPLVDAAVARYAASQTVEEDLSIPMKRAVLETLMGRFDVAGEARTLFDVAAMTAVSLMKVFQGSRKTLVLPDL